MNEGFSLENWPFVNLSFVSAMSAFSLISVEGRRVNQVGSGGGLWPDLRRSFCIKALTGSCVRRHGPAGAASRAALKHSQEHPPAKIARQDAT